MPYKLLINDINNTIEVAILYQVVVSQLTYRFH